MNGLSGAVVSIVVCAVILGARIGTPNPVFAAEASLHEVRNIVSEELQSIHSIRVKYLYSVESHPPYQIGKGTSECEWIRQGDQIFRYMKPKKFPGGNWIGRLQAFDGETCHSVTFDPEDPNRYKNLYRVHSPPPQDWNTTTPADFIGLRILDSSETLASMLAKEGVKIVGIEQVETESTLHLDLGVLVSPSGIEWKVHAWLLPDRRYLPAKLHFTADANLPKSKEVGLASNPFYSLRCLKWGKFKDNQFGQLRDFPTLATKDNTLGLLTFETTDLTFNEPIPDSQFRVSPHIGTEVTERANPTDPDQKVWIEGGGPAAGARQRELVKNASESAEVAAVKPPSNDLIVDARPNEGNWAYRLRLFAFVACGITITLYGALVWRKST